MLYHDAPTSYLRTWVVEDLINIQKVLGELESPEENRFRVENLTENVRFYAHQLAECVEELAVRGQLTAARVAGTQLSLDVLERDLEDGIEKVAASGESVDDTEYPF